MIKVNEIAGGCHSCTSSHYRGLAVDIDDSTNTTAMVQECWNMGGSYAADEKTHIHCNFA
ncbi:hypothetical protein MAR_034862 [Mya arenaria]|uniref:Uncharacterized protein n=2 Tax=Mya arenaria TaxID=6604 RepID=A0ABY7EM17_MYAAR|nr:hypothetical protein MAR_034862 [Mya arenaria]